MSVLFPITTWAGVRQQPGLALAGGSGGLGLPPGGSGATRLLLLLDPREDRVSQFIEMRRRLQFLTDPREDCIGDFDDIRLHPRVHRTSNPGFVEINDKPPGDERKKDRAEI